MNLINKLALLKNILAAKCIKPVPVYCQWEVTERCNLRCSFCGVIGESPKWKPELDTAAAKDIITQLADMGTRIIHFSGGEPTLRDDLAELLTFAKKKRITTIVTSNGSASDDRMRQVLGADYIRLSLDGLEERHNRLRGSDKAFQRVLEAAGLLRANKIAPFYVSLVSAETSLNDMQNLVDFTREQKGRIQFSPAGITACSKENPQPEDIRAEQKQFIFELSRFTDMIKEIHRKNPDVVIYDYPYMEVLEMGGLGRAGCLALRTAISLKPNGWISFPCNEFPLRMWKNRLAEGYYSEEADKIRSEMGKWWFCRRCVIRCMISASNLCNFRHMLPTYFLWRKL